MENGEIKVDEQDLEIKNVEQKNDKDIA